MSVTPQWLFVGWVFAVPTVCSVRTYRGGRDDNNVLPDCRTYNMVPHNVSHSDMRHEEVRAAMAHAGIYNASKNNAKPTAIFLLGPSSVGKSYASAEVSKFIGKNLTGLAEHDTVTVDGDDVRTYHAAYAALVKQGLDHSPPCLWHSSFHGGARPYGGSVGHTKKRIFKQAVINKQNLLLPDTCHDAKCKKYVQYLKAEGYTIHVLNIYADKDVVGRRGVNRSALSGKVYNPANFIPGLSAFVPLSIVCNGAYMFIHNTDTPTVEQTGECSGMDAPYSVGVTQELRDAMAKVKKHAGVAAIPDLTKPSF